MSLSGGSPAAIGWQDPAWFPADLDVRGARFAMLRIDADVIEQSTFMDTRIAADLGLSSAVAADVVELGKQANAQPIGWLFHTSFCCSTLLARALHDHPRTVVYREPLVLRRLADARHEGMRALPWLQECVDLLGRPWQAHGRVVVKPTHAALNIALDLMRASPRSRALVLTSPLQDFLASNVKKAPETQARIPLLVEMALSAGQFHRRLPREALKPPSLIAAAGLQWAAQRELILELAESVGRERLAVLGADDLLADLRDAAARCDAWWGLQPDSVLRDRRIAEVSGRHAKLESREYGPETRAYEVALIQRMHGSLLDEALTWTQRNVLPAMRQEAITLERGSWSLMGACNE